MKHTLKINAEERPKISEFYILLSELAFLKDIDKHLTEENMWKQKGNLFFFLLHFENM